MGQIGVFMTILEIVSPQNTKPSLFRNRVHDHTGQIFLPAIEHSVYITHAPDIPQSFGSLYYFTSYITQCQNYRTPRQTFTLLSAVDPQFFCILAIPALFNFVREWQPGVDLKFHSSIGQNHTLEVFFCRISPPPLHRPVSPLPLCSNTDFFFLCTWEVHTFFIWQVRGDGGFGKFQSVCS